MPAELCVELMPVIGPDFADTERELIDDMIDEVDGVGLGMPLVDFERPHARCILDGRILEAANLLPSFSDEGRKLDVHLDMMA